MNMKNKLISIGLMFLMALSLFMPSCSDEQERPVFPLSAEMFYSVADKQVAFTALTHSAVDWNWDFGDGNSSTDKNPVYVYTDGGYYDVVLTATDANGQQVTTSQSIAVAVTPYILLTGGPTANGKTWKVSAGHSPNDKLVNSDPELSLFDDDIPVLPTGAFDLYLGLPEIYTDEYTFFYDGSYSIDTKDGAAFGGIVYALLTGQGITKTGGKAVFGADAFALFTYTMDEGATFKFVESEDYTIFSAFGGEIIPPGIPVSTYKDMMTIDFPRSNAFLGVKDYHPKVMLEEVNDKTFRAVIFLTMSPDAVISGIPLSTTALILTFELVE